MPGPAGADIPVEVSLGVEDWQWLDATIDNTGSIAAVDGDDRAVEQGRQIRAAVWEAARVHPRSMDGWSGWPPVDDELTVSLPAAAWRFAIQELRRWDQVSRDTGSGSEPRGIAIASFLAEQLRSP